LPHPAKVRVKAKSVINDNENIFLPILRFTSFPVTHLANLFWISLLYRTSLSDFQGQPQNYPSQPHPELRLGSRRITPLDILGQSQLRNLLGRHPKTHRYCRGTTK
jgi:hypothetical protein